MLKKVRKAFTMASASDQALDNSVMGGTGGGKIPADGTGRSSSNLYIFTQLTSSGVIQLDPWLEPFKDALKSRFSRAQKWIKTIDETEGGLDKFSKGFEKFGFVVHENGDITYREWAPNALRAYLIGDFSMTSSFAPSTSADQNLIVDEWNRDATPMTRGEYGVWEVTIPANDGQLGIPHNSKVKVGYLVWA